MHHADADPVVRMAVAAATATDALPHFPDVGTARALWQELATAALPYCVLAYTDLAPDGSSHAVAVEILVARDRAMDFERIAAAVGGKRLLRRGRDATFGTSEHLAYDADADCLLLLRAHFQLPLSLACGTTASSPHQAAALQTRTLHPSHGCHCLEPAFAMLLAACWQSRDPRLRLWRPELPVDAERLAEHTRHLLGADAAAQLPNVTIAVRRGLAALRGHQRLTARLGAAVTRRGRRWHEAPPPVPATGGARIALIGCDGSGKSTASQVLADWLRPVLRVRCMYLGSGQGSSSLLRWPLLVLHRLSYRRRTRHPGKPRTAAKGAGGAPKRTGFRRWLLPLWSLVLAREKLGKLATVGGASTAGSVVICDRWPQNEIMAFNDGPLLDAWHARPRGLRRWLGRRERRPYRLAERHPPDLIVKLRVSPAVALQRKPDMLADEVARRVDAVDTLTFGGGATTRRIDADAPLEQVLRTLKCAVWTEL